MEMQFLSGKFMMQFFGTFLEKQLRQNEQVKVGNVNFFYNKYGDLGWDRSIDQWDENKMSQDIVSLLSE